MIFGPSARTATEALELPSDWTVWLKTIPILTGSVLRAPVGIVADQIGARWTFSGLLILGGGGIGGISLAPAGPEAIVVVLPCVLLCGLLGTTFTVGVQAISQVCSTQRIGLMLGIFGAGNIGSVGATLGLPLLITAFGWRFAFQLFAATIIASGVGYFFFHASAGPRTHRGAGRGGLRQTWTTLLHPVVWCLGAFYMASFGASVAISLILNDWYSDVYNASAPRAALLATSFAVSASLARIPGGMLSDRLSAQRVLQWSLAGAGLALVPVLARPPVLTAAGLVLLSGICLGFAMAATYAMIPQRFPHTVGTVGGVVGALGGLSGFYLPFASSALETAYAPVLGLLPFVVLSAGAFVLARTVASPIDLPGAAHEPS